MLLNDSEEHEHEKKYSTIAIQEKYTTHSTRVANSQMKVFPRVFQGNFC